MTSPPPAPASGDSEPALPPSVPADMALWDEADMRVMRGPAAAFADTVAGNPDGASSVATIGHIGRYALKHQLGEGGIGTVYAAHDPLLSRLIAVKTLHVEVPQSQRASFNALFLAEARAAAALNHPHIVTVFDAGISDHRAYIAMELLKGRDLRQLRRDGWRATPLQAALIVRRVADALGYAHTKGVVHRDVKPANIFMIGRTQPKVLDFGIARVAHQHDAAGADGDIAAGSPYYMAPEQVRGEPVDRRADVFSLGVVLYELLTDVKPFRGATLDEITHAVLTHEPASAHALAPAVPATLAAIAAKALAKNPERRYRSARAFARDLRQWLDENPSALDFDALPEPAPSRAPRWFAAAALGVLAVGAALAIGWSARTPSGLAETSGPANARSAAGPTESRRADQVAMLPAATPVASVAAPERIGVAPASVGDAALTTAGTAAPEALAAATPGSAAKRPPGTVGKEPREAAPYKRAREAHAREPANPLLAAKAATGVLRIAISPWGEVEVDGRAAGTSPPLTELSLSAGRHQIVIRNADLPPHSAVVDVSAEQPVNVRHKF